MPYELEARYKEAYQVARVTVRMAKGLRVLGFILAALMLLAGLISFSGNSLEAASGLMMLAGAAITVVGTLAIYMVLMAQAQITAAVIDTAINTSPLIDLNLKSTMIETLD